MHRWWRRSLCCRATQGVVVFVCQPPWRILEQLVQQQMEWPMVTERELPGRDYRFVVVRDKAMAMTRYKEMAPEWPVDGPEWSWCKWPLCGPVMAQRWLRVAWKCPRFAQKWPWVAQGRSYPGWPNVNGGVAALADKDRVTRTCQTVTEDQRTGPKLTERTRVACAVERRRGLCRGGRQLVVKGVAGRLCPAIPGDRRCPIRRMSQGSPEMGRPL